ncbi:MAG: hypothetical protein RLZZ15_777 [Verrucomicrobiota bacterium]|jgi:hypothetical protein
MSSKYQLRSDPARGGVGPVRDRGELDWTDPATAAAAPAAAVAPAMSGVSPKLQDLLIREAHLRLSRAALAPAMAAQEVALQEVIAAKPGMFSFQSKEKRAAYEAQLAETRETAQMLRDGVAQLDRVEPHLSKMLRDEIEDLLRAACPEYVAALAARQQREDWKRCVERFAARVYEFLQALGSSRNMACTGYTRERQMYSQAAVQGFVAAIAAAEKVEAEVVFANRIADMQLKMFRESGLDATPLPKLPAATYGVWVSTLSSRSLAEVQVQFDTMIAQVRQLYETGVPQLVGQSQAADEANGSLIDNFLETAWQQLRDEIVAFVNPADTEASVGATERMLVDLARKTIHGRLREAGPAPKG